VAKTKDFSGEGFNQDLIINDYFNLAAAEIYATYGHRVRLNRKTLRKSFTRTRSYSPTA